MGIYNRVNHFETPCTLTYCGGATPPGTPKWTPQKSIFLTAQLRVPVFYDIRRYLTDKYFDSTFLEVP